MSKLKYVFIILLFSRVTLANEVCRKWFDNSKLKPSDKNCQIRCVSLKIDMGTFDCAHYCDKFCNLEECETDPYWNAKIKAGRPPNWNLASETSVEWSDGERRHVEKALSRLPEQLKSIPFDGLYRMKKVDTSNQSRNNF